FAAPQATAAPEGLAVAVPQASRVPGQRLPALVLAFAARFCGTSSFDVAYADGSIRQKSAMVPGIFATELPLALSLSLDGSLEAAAQLIQSARRELAELSPYTTDLLLR